MHAIFGHRRFWGTREQPQRASGEHLEHPARPQLFLELASVSQKGIGMALALPHPTAPG